VNTGFVAPKWRFTAVIVEGEEHPVSSPGAVDTGRVIVEGAESAFARLEESVGADHLPRPETFAGPEPWRGGPAWLTESAVRDGKVPPPEIVTREYAEMRPSRSVTSKRWPADWYTTRFERESVVDESAVREIERYVDRNPDATVPAVLGALCLPPSYEDTVREALE
jgi:hypothetical protein